MTASNKITGVVFTDIGQGASFMALEWVQRAIREKVGFAPHPGTLNLRLESVEAKQSWKELKESHEGIDVPPAETSFCHARCYLARFTQSPRSDKDDGTVAVLVPEVDSYPEDKLEVIAPYHVKDTLKVKDGDHLTLEFVGK
ncbi:MAG: DUF120 domain-containing protein [Deltaproteobacteria bacterium]|nr:DUF120 domain-containing protein [Deltaproteobacteria bacterium]